MLGYHKIGRPPEAWWSWQYVPSDTFAAQIEVMRDDGWEAIGAEQLIRGLDTPAALPRRTFLVTFDDAYLSLCDEAIDQLARLELPAVVFVPTAFVGAWNDFDRDIEPPERICDWDALRELCRKGVSVQSHGTSHRAFSSLTRAAQLEEAATSRRLIEAEIGTRVELLAYPYGDAGDEPELPRALRTAGYRAAFCYGGGSCRLPADDRYRLPRLAMGPDTDLREALRIPG